MGSILHIKYNCNRILTSQRHNVHLFRRASAIKAMDNLKVEPGSQKESTDHTGTNKGMTLKTGTGTGTSFLETNYIMV